MTKLLDDEVEEDEQFWNQEALKEVLFIYPLMCSCYYRLCIYISWYLQEEHDDNYEAEAEVADEFDSDFNDDVTTLFLVLLNIKYFYSSKCS